MIFSGKALVPSSKRARTTLWRLEHSGHFPRRRVITPKIVVWYEAAELTQKPQPGKNNFACYLFVTYF